jgi:hypothetical protein
MITIIRYHCHLSFPNIHIFPIPQHVSQLSQLHARAPRMFEWLVDMGAASCPGLKQLSPEPLLESLLQCPSCHFGWDMMGPVERFKAGENPIYLGIF